MRPAVLLALCALSGGAALTRADEAGPTPQSTPKPFSAVVDIQGAGSIAYLDPLFVAVRITPLRDIDVEAIRVLPLGALKAIYVAPTDGSDSGWQCRFGANAGVAERPFVATCEVGDPVGPARQLWSPTVFYPPSRQKLAVEITLIQAGNPVSYFEEIFVDLGAPKVGVVYGGFFGAFLLAVFTTLRAGLDRRSDPAPAAAAANPPPVAEPWRRMVGSAAIVARGVTRILATCVVGGICALVVILLAQVTEGIKPPLSIHVQDFWGGVVVGLFCVPLSRWLAERLAG